MFNILGSSIKEEFKPNNLEGLQTKVENSKPPTVEYELPDKVSYVFMTSIL